jgi:hypothetical protein
MKVVTSRHSSDPKKFTILVTFQNSQTFASDGFLELAGLKETLHQISNLLGTVKRKNSYAM